MAPRKQTLDQWVAEAFLDDDKDGKCTMLSLVHIVGTAENEIHTVKFGGSKSWSPKELGELFMHKAESYADELPGVQSFCLLAFYGERKEPQARKPFMINGATEFHGLATEGPTSGGLTQQAMRHSEAIIQMAFRQTAMLFETSQRTVHELTKQNESLMQENRDAFQIMREMLMERATHAHDFRMKELEFQRSSDQRQKLMTMIPALVNNLTGRELFPQNGDGGEDTALIETIATELDEATLIKLADALPPHIMGILASRMKKIFDAKNKQREDGERRLKSGTNPEVDAMGGEQ